VDDIAGRCVLVGMVMAAAIAVLHGPTARAERLPLVPKPSTPRPEVKSVSRDFRLELRYFGDADKPYYSLTLLAMAAEKAPPEARPFDAAVLIDPKQMRAIVEHLSLEGFLDEANERDDAPDTKRPAPKGPCYRITAGPFRVVANGRTVKELYFEEQLWGLDLLPRLDGLREALAACYRAGWKRPVGGPLLCPVCAAKPLAAGARQCTSCGGKTPSGALKLCAKCSEKSGKCASCGAVATSPATAAMDRLIGRLSGHRKQWLSAGDGLAVGSPQHLAALIAQLGADSYKIREAATRKLIALGQKAVRSVLEAKAAEEGLDPEIASRIQRIFSKFDVRQGRRVTDHTTGLTITLSADGKSITAIRAGKIVWRHQTSQPATSLQLKDGKLLTLPRRRQIDIKTGRLIHPAPTVTYGAWRL